MTAALKRTGAMLCAPDAHTRWEADSTHAMTTHRRPHVQHGVTSTWRPQHKCDPARASMHTQCARLVKKNARPSAATA